MIERLASADFNMSQDAVRRRCYRARKEREAEASLTARQASVCVCTGCLNPEAMSRTHVR